eukprot:scaffold142047_cov37-Prasinocladus_malaysianus.AAC.1
MKASAVSRQVGNATPTAAVTRDGLARHCCVAPSRRRVSTFPSCSPAVQGASHRQNLLVKNASLSDGPGHEMKDDAEAARARREAAKNVLLGRNTVTLPPSTGKPGRFGANLDERISSGEFTIGGTGSKKERLTRPMRKLLATDPFGPGEALPLSQTAPETSLKIYVPGYLRDTHNGDACLIRDVLQQTSSSIIAAWLETTVLTYVLNNLGCCLARCRVTETYVANSVAQCIRQKYSTRIYRIFRSPLNFVICDASILHMILSWTSKCVMCHRLDCILDYCILASMI